MQTSRLADVSSSRTVSPEHVREEMLRLAAFGSGLAVALALALPGRLAVLVCLNAYAIAATYARGGRSLLTPSLLFSLTLTLFGFSGFAATEYLARTHHMPSYLAAFGGLERNGALGAFQLASLASLVGAAITRGRGVRQVSVGDLRSVVEALRRSTGALAFGVVTLAFNVSLRPFDQLLARDDYLIPTPFGGVLTYLMIPAAALLGLALRSSRWPGRLASLGLFFGLELFSFALSSRMMSLVALMYFVGLALGSRRARPFLLLAGVGTALILVPIPLHMRGLAVQGLLPNIEALPSVTFFAYDIYLTTLANFLSGFNVVALTIYSAGHIDWSAFWFSVGPLPGSLLASPAGASLRLSSSVPYAGLGEVANHGAWFTAVFFLFAGGIFGLAESATARLLKAGRYVYISVAPTGVAFLAAILFAQYNLRTACRMLYVTVLLYVIMSAIARRSPRTTARLVGPPPSLVSTPRHSRARLFP